jgi:hypothetical protein
MLSISSSFHASSSVFDEENDDVSVVSVVAPIEKEIRFFGG